MSFIINPNIINMISQNDVFYIANLARIHLSEKEIDPLAKDLESILNYMTQLDELNVSNVEPTSHVLPLKNIYRNDQIHASLSQDDAISIAISQQNGSFKVPQIIE